MKSYFAVIFILLPALFLGIYACGDDDDDDDKTAGDSDDDDDDDNDDDNDDDDMCTPSLRYSQNFDSYSPGDLLPDDWSIWEGSTVAITDLDSASTPNSLSVGGLTDVHLKHMWRTMIFIPLPAERCDAWSASIAASIKGDPSQNNFYICLDDDFSDDYYYNCAESSWSDPQDTWRTIRLDFDDVSMTLDTYIDDVHVDGPVTLEQAPQYLLLDAGGVSDGSYFSYGTVFDDVMIFDQGWTL